MSFEWPDDQHDATEHLQGILNEARDTIDDLVAQNKQLRADNERLMSINTMLTEQLRKLIVAGKDLLRF